MTPLSCRAAAGAAAERLKIYAQPQRLMIVSRLVDGEKSVGEIEAATGIGQPALSQQLAALRRAGVVRTRRASKLVFYRLADDRVLACVRGIEAMFNDDPMGARNVRTTTTAVTPERPTQLLAGAASFARMV